MNKKTFWVTGIIFILITAGIWSHYRTDPVPVTVTTVKYGLVEATAANSRAGTVKACRHAKLSLAMGGQIGELPIKEGDQVKLGQVLISLWNDDLKSQLELAKREYQAATAKARAECVLADVAQKEAARTLTLQKKGAISADAAERIQGEAKSRSAACSAAKRTIEVSESRIAVSQATLERTILRAPFDGTIGEINGELNEFITPSPVGVATLPVVELFDSSCLYVTAPIDEVDAPGIIIGMPVRISLDAFPKQTFTGTIKRVAAYVLDREKQARTVDIEVTLDPSTNTRDLLPGYSADIEILLDSKEKVLRIPTEAVRDDNQVFVYQSADQALISKTIEPGLRNWRWVEIISGLEEEEQVVTSSDQADIQAGTIVTIKPSSD